MSNQVKQDDYDSEPVRYCARCYSLKVKYEEALDAECCAECGSTDIQESLIEDWEKKYVRRYGRKFTQKTEDPKSTYFFKLSIKELKEKVASSLRWKDIIKSIYPHFPEGYGKVDSIILFFDTLIRQNKVDELRLFLFKHFKY